MSPIDLAFVVRLGLYAWLSLLGFCVLHGILFGGINTTGLLSHPRSERSSADRMTLLLATLGFAFYYVTTALRTPLDPVDPSLPDVSSDILVGLLGANSVYLATKFGQTRAGRAP